MNRTLLTERNGCATVSFAERPSIEFHISEKEIGRGSSCIVYHAVCSDHTEHLLKEYYPKYLELQRDNTGRIIAAEDKQGAFEQGLMRFQNGCERQKAIRLSNEGLKNFTCNVQGYYKANGTEYIDMTCFSGQTYDHVQEKSVYDLMLRMRTLTQVVGNYHKAGLLHLDIKPENIYVRPENETVEDVMLFDFDSVTPIPDVKGSKVLSCTRVWAAPEQLLPDKRKRICPATDLFAIGEIIFYQLFSRHSTNAERRSFVTSYSYDHTAAIFKDMNPKVFPLLDDLLSHTICGVVGKRYQSADELIAKLDEIIRIADPKEPYLKSNIPAMQDFFVGRDEEIETIHRKLTENRILILSGIGGIGKSELAKHYAEYYRDEYDAIIFAPYVSDVNMLLQDDIAIPLYNFAPYSEEKSEEYCTRKLRKLQELCDERTLIIVDNLDREDDPDLNKLLDLGCSLLITTRMDFSDYGYGQQLALDALANREKVNEIFAHYYTKPLSVADKEYVEQIIDSVSGHTMTVELLAKQMIAGRVTPQKMLMKLQEGGISESGKEKVRMGKDGKLTAQSAYDHIKALFDLSELDEDERYILANLSLVPYTGISAEMFHDWCELKGYETLNSLSAEGWVRWDREKDFVSLHPVVSEVIQAIATSESFASFFKNLTEYINSEDEGNTITVSERMFLETLSSQIIRAIKKHHYLSQDVSAVLLGIGNLYYRDIKFDMAEQSFSLSLAIIEEIEDPNSFSSLLCRASVGMMLATIGGTTHDRDKILEGINILDACLEQFHNGIAGHDDLYEEISTVYNYLGMAYEDLPDTNKALEMYEKGKQILEEHNEKLTDDYLGIAIFYNNIGYLYDHEEKDYKRACENYEKALHYYRKIGNESPHIIKSLYHLGLIYADATYEGYNLSKANELAKEVLPIAEKLFDDKHPLYIHSLYLYGKTELLLGNEREGKVCLAKALAVYKDNLQNDHPTLVWLRSVLG